MNNVTLGLLATLVVLAFLYFARRRSRLMRED
jgi:hypothetical protein